MKAKHPLVSALTIVGCTIIAIVVLIIVGVGVTAAMFGDSDEAYWGLTLCLMVIAPVALLLGFTLAIMRFVRDRRAQKIRDESNVA